jgi:hypothetical protein
VYNCRHNRKAISNRDMVLNINPNPRGSKTPNRGRKTLFDPAILGERFRANERMFDWEASSGVFRSLAPHHHIANGLLRAAQIAQLCEAPLLRQVPRPRSSAPFSHLGITEQIFASRNF